MKKNLMFLLIAVFVIMPFVSHAKTAISDSELGTITAQEGVTMNFSSFSIGNSQISTQTWGNSATSSPINDLYPRRIHLFRVISFFLNKIFLNAHRGGTQVSNNTDSNSSYSGTSFMGGVSGTNFYSAGSITITAH